MKKVLSNKLIIAMLVIPGLSVFIFAIVAPIIYSLYLGMTNWQGIGKMNYIGLKNFRKIVFEDSVFYKSLFHAMILGIATIVIQHPISIILAAMIDKIGGRWEKVFRTLFFIPCVISVVVISKMWVAVLDPKYGILNKLLEIFGLSSLKQAWLSNPNTALYSIIIIVMWQGFGYAFLLYYSGIKGISREMYEAAKIDGAGIVKTYTKVILPLIRPVMRVTMIMAIIASFKQMEIVYLTTDGGPGNTTQFVANYLYKTAFQSYKYGYANAISVLFVLFSLTITLLFNKLFQSEEL